MMKSLFLLGLIFVMIFGLSGCATIIDGEIQTITITSEPSGAIAKVDTHTIKTPGQVALKRGKKYTVTFNKEGYETGVFQITYKIAPWFWGNILLGGIPGMIVDGVTGAYGKLTPESVHMSLHKKE